MGEATTQILQGQFDAAKVKALRPRDIAANKVLTAVKTNPDYTFSDVKRIIGETYPRRYATGEVFDYIVERVIADYVRPNLPKAQATELMKKKIENVNQELTLARKDDLTGLPRRKLFLAMLQQEHKRREPIKIAMFDLDNFKQINTKYGHVGGDKALKGFARLLEACFPSATRWGGEEFIIAEPEEIDIEGKMKVLRDAFKQFTDTEFPNHGLPVGTFSDGQTILASDGDIEETIRRSDDALSISKQTGRNKTTHWTPQTPRKLVSIVSPR